MTEQVWTSVITLLTALLPVTVYAWTREYFGAKGKNFATRQDIRELQHQLQENTNITKAIERTYSRDDFLWRSELAYRQQQLSEFYGPAYGYVMSQKDIYQLWMEGKMPEANLEFKRILSGQNQLLRDLIINKSHLIDGAAMPASFGQFFASTLIFDLYAGRTNDGAVPKNLTGDIRTKYPDEFDAHIKNTTERLKRRIELLNAKYTSPLE